MANKYTVQESNNLAIGQGRSMFVDTIGQDVTPPTGTVFIAIQCVNDTRFTELSAVDNTQCYGTDGVDAAVSGVYAGGVGDRVPSAVTFPAGTVIYGRWKQFDLANGIVIAYCGG